MSDYDSEYLVGWNRDAPTHILKMAEDGTLVMIKAWGRMIPSDEAHQIAFGGGVDKDGNVVFTFFKAIVDLFSTVQIETQPLFPFYPSSYDSIHHVTLTVAPNPVWSYLQALEHSLSTTDAELLWNREEGISGISAAEFLLGGKAKIHRPTTTTISSGAGTFKKIYAIDTSNGEIVWSHLLGLGWAEEKGPDALGQWWCEEKGKEKATKAAEEVTRPEVVLVTQRFAANTLVDTVIFHIDALTGDDVREGVPESQKIQGLLQGYNAFSLQNETRAVVMLDEFLQCSAVFLAKYANLVATLQSKKVCDVKMILTETWLVYHCYDDDAACGTAGLGQAKGWRMVSVEMYEDLAEKRRVRPSPSLDIPLSGTSSYNPDMRDVTDATTSTNCNT
ncbi:hypothetical protein JOM56_009365 [Amanita muscaria]